MLKAIQVALLLIACPLALEASGRALDQDLSKDDGTKPQLGEVLVGTSTEVVRSARKLAQAGKRSPSPTPKTSPKRSPSPKTSPKRSPTSSPKASPRSSPRISAAQDTSGRLNWQSILAEHNGYRSKHGVSALQWDNALANVAQDWADGCEMEHSDFPYGENLFLGPVEWSVAYWYNEICEYDYRNPRFSMATGHFTQVVWDGTVKVGCALGSCPNGVKVGAGQRWKGDFLVCEYFPPGNYQGRFSTNVPPLEAGESLPGACNGRGK